MTKFIIGRRYNKHGISDYYAGQCRETNLPMFTGKADALTYTNQNTAYGMTIRLRRILPTIMGGAPASYELVEIQDAGVANVLPA